MIIKNIRLFKNVDEKVIKNLLNKSRKENYKKGEYIHYEGDICTRVDFIESGKVEVEHLSELGEKRVFNIYGKGEILGLNLSLSTNQYYIMNFVANTDVSITSISINDLIYTAQKNQNLLLNLLNHLAEKSIFVGQKLKKEFKTTIRQNLFSLLASQSRKQNTKTVILPFSKTKIAEIFGVSRTSVSRELKKMEEENLIIVNRDKITLLYNEI